MTVLMCRQCSHSIRSHAITSEGYHCRTCGCKRRFMR